MPKLPDNEQNSQPDQVVLNLPRDPSNLQSLHLNRNSPSNPNLGSNINPRAASTTCRTLSNLPSLNPKSRFDELNYPASLRHEPSNSLSEIDSDDEDGSISDKLHPKNNLLIGWRAAMESAFFTAITTVLVSSLVIPSLKKQELCGLNLWKWSLMLLVVLCGHRITVWILWLSVFLIEVRFPLQVKVLYFVYGLRKSVRNCTWLALVLLSWNLLFHDQIKNSGIYHVSRFLMAILAASVIWLVKILLVKMLASNFYVDTYFDRMKETVFHQYILQALDCKPLTDEERKELKDAATAMEAEEERKGKEKGKVDTMSQMEKFVCRRMDIESKLKMLGKLSTASATARSVSRLMRHVMRNELLMLNQETDQRKEKIGKAEPEITTEEAARKYAKRIFKNVSGGKEFVEEEDLLRFLIKDEVNAILPVFKGNLEDGKLKKSVFQDWVVTAYQERKSLGHALSDTMTAVQQLHKMASAVVLVIIIIVFLFVMRMTSTKVFLAVSTQLWLMGFVFQNTGRTIFESIVFVFVRRPFDVGDRCVIDDVQMIVEEMSIMTTTFLRYDQEKIYYPNAVLLTKPISNFNRSPPMGDSVEFSIDASTPVETIDKLNKYIKEYIEKNHEYWQAKHSLLVKEIEDVHKMKMALNVLHTINHQNFPEKNRRRSALVLELKKLFEKLDIKYSLLPQQIHLTKINHG